MFEARACSGPKAPFRAGQMGTVPFFFGLNFLEPSRVGLMRLAEVRILARIFFLVVLFFLIDFLEVIGR